MCMPSHSSRVQHFAASCTEAHQAPLSMGFSRQEYWSRLPCPPPGALPDPGLETMSLLSPALAGRFFTTSAAWEALTDKGLVSKIYKQLMRLFVTASKQTTHSKK